MVKPRSQEALDEKLQLPSSVVAVVEAGERVVVLSVVDWSGEERARIAARGSDRVSMGQEQIWEQTGVRTCAQRLVLGEVELEGSMRWSSFPGLRDGSTVQLTVVVDQVRLWCCGVVV